MEDENRRPSMDKVEQLAPGQQLKKPSEALAKAIKNCASATAKSDRQVATENATKSAKDGGKKSENNYVTKIKIYPVTSAFRPPRLRSDSRTVSVISISSGRGLRRGRVGLNRETVPHLRYCGVQDGLLKLCKPGF